MVHFTFHLAQRAFKTAHQRTVVATGTALLKTGGQIGVGKLQIRRMWPELCLMQNST